MMQCNYFMQYYSACLRWLVSLIYSLGVLLDDAVQILYAVLFCLFEVASKFKYSHWQSC